MAASSHSVAGPAPRLTIPFGGLMLLGALVIFGAAYLIAGVYGRESDRRVENLDALVVVAEEPSGAPLLTVLASRVEFDTRSITVPAGQPVHIRLDNEDAGIYHNIAVYHDEAATDLVARGRLFDGPKVRDYRFGGFEPGTYHFQCDLHPAMSGTFLVE
jgi:plastocyanin